MSTRPLFRWMNIITLACMLLLNITGTTVQAAPLTEPTPVLMTDSADYAPNTIVTVTGYGFEPNTEYAMPVIRPNGSIVYGDGSFLPGYDTVFSNINGELQYLYQLNGILGLYEVRAYRVDSWDGSDYTAVPAARITFTDGPGPSANLDQCANGSFAAPTTDCEWVNGNLGPSKAHYVEDDSIAYRMRLSNIPTDGSVQTLTIGWDTTKSGTHALDYLTGYDRTVVDADPCLGVSGCGAPSTFPIPLDSYVATSGITQIPGDLTLFGGTITAVSDYITAGEETRITISFTASVANPVLAWGGHIASRRDWGEGNAAVNISGSPYHMRLKGLNGAGGSQDRSLSATAVIYPAQITITKQADPQGPAAFGFTAAPAPLAPFTLVDDGTSANTIVFDQITTFGTYTVGETLPAGWSLDGITCQDPTGGTTVDLAAAAASIGLVEGDTVACIFTNSQQAGTLTVIKTVVNRYGGGLQVGDFPLFVNGEPVTSGTPVSLPVGAYTVSETQQAGYTASAWGGDCAAGGTITLGAGETKTCAITNSDVQPLLTVTKVVDNTGGGGKQVGDFPLFVDATPVTSGAQNGFNAGTYIVSETTDGSYTAVFSGDCAADGTVTLAVGDVKACTITNTFNARPGIQVVKSYTGGPFTLGGSIPYSYLITNTGNVALTGVTLIDDVLGAVALGMTTLQPGQHTNGTANHLVTQANIDAGTLTNIATVTGTMPAGGTVTDTDTQTVTFTQTGGITLDKTATETVFTAAGATLHYTLVATNSGSVTLTNVIISDPKLGTLACAPAQPAMLAPDATLTCTGTYTTTQADLDAGTVDNTATAQGAFASQTYSATDSASVPADQNPALTIDKTADTTTYANVGDEINYSYLVTNSGNVTLYGIQVVDNLIAAVTCPDTTAGLLPAGTITCTASYTITQKDLDAGRVTNVAYATDGQTRSEPDEVTITGAQTPAITISKSPDLQQVASGATATFQISVANTGNVTLTGVTVSDPLAPDCDRMIGILAPSGGSTYTCTLTVTADMTNVATVTATPPQGSSLTDSDTAVVDVLPAIAVTKTAGPLTISEPGGTITFTVRVENTSTEAVTLTGLTDDVYGELDDQGTCALPQTIAAGGAYECAFTGLVSGDAGSSHVDVITGTASDDEGNPASDTGTATVAIGDALPSVTLEKSASPTALPEPGGDFTYTLTITNHSVEPVTITALSDDYPVSAQCSALVGTSLAAGASVNCTYTANHVEAGSYFNNASVTVEDNEGNEASGGDTETVRVTNVNPTVTLTKSADPITLPEPGGLFNFALTITNTSVEPVIITALSDSYPLSAACTALVDTTLAAGATATCDYTVHHSEIGSYPNTATVTVADNEGGTASDSDSQTVTVTDVRPTVTLEKSVTPGTLAEPGGLFTFTLTISNTSTVPVEITALSDDNALSAECLGLIGDTLPAGQQVSCSYTVSHTDAGSYDNSASVTVEDNQGNPASATDTQTVAVTDILPAVTLVKSATPTTLPEPGGVFTFTLTLTNISVEPVTIIALSDSYPLSAECLALVDDILPAGASASCTYPVTHTQTGSYHNTASVTVVDNENNPASASDSQTVTVTDTLPAVDLTKTVDSNGTFNAGDTATYTLTITNTSLEPVTITALTDTNPLSAQCTALLGTTLAAGASAACTYTVTHEAAGTYPNTANVTVTDNEQGSASDTAEQSVTFYAPVVSKTANGTYSEVHDWQVFKTVNTPAQSRLAGQSADFFWTVRVDETVHGETYLVVGDITVVNPNPDDPMTLALTDVLDDGSVATISACTGGTWASPNLTVPAGAAAVCSYSVVPVGNLDAFNAALPDQVTLSVVYGAAGDPAFFPTVTITNGGALNGTYEGWCADMDSNIFQNTDYTANVYSSFETIPAGLIEKPENLDLVNWIINQDFVGKPAGGTLGSYTFGDVQRAIWELLEEDGSYRTDGLYAWNQARVDQIKAAAAANGEGFTPTCGDFVAVILQPVGGEQIITLALVTFASLGLDCAESNVVTAVLNGITFPASAEILWTSNPIDPTATIDDDQAPGLPATVDADTTFTYMDAQRYTCSTNPADYANGFYRYTESNTAVLTFASGSDSATASTVVNCRRPVIEVVKTASITTVPETGGSATFTFEVRNTGPVAAAITSLTDSKFGALTGDDDCQVGTMLAPAANCTFASVFAIPAGDFPGAHVNVFTALIADQAGNTATGSDDAAITYTDVKPGITVSKTAENAPASVPETGGSVRFTFVVTNTSLEAAEITQLSDNRFGTLAGDDDCKVGKVLAGSGGTCSFEATFTIPAGDYPGSHTNIFTARATDGDGNYATASDSETITYTDVLTDISVTKTANPTTVPEPGANVTYTFTVTNNGLETATIKTLTDTKFGTLYGNATCKVGTVLPSGASCAFSLTRKITGNAGAVHVNVFTATAADNDGIRDSASDDATVTVTDVLPSIQVDKTSSPTTALFTGAYATFYVKVKNTSVESVVLTSLVDDVFGDLNGKGTCSAPRTILKGATYTCYFRSWISSPLTVFETTYHTDTVTGVAHDNENNEATDTGTTNVKFYWRGRTSTYWKGHATLWPKFSLVNHLGQTVAISTTTAVTRVFDIPRELLKCTATTCILDLNGDGKNDTLMQATGYAGGTDLAGKAQTLLRAAVAGLLNERWMGVRYPAYDSVAKLIQAVNTTLAAQDLDAYTQSAAELDWWNNGVQ